MAQGLFTVGFTVTEILRIQARAKEMLMEGKTLMSWADSGSNVTKQFPMTVKETLEECAHALRVLDRASYGRRRNILNSIINYFAK